MKRRTFAKSSFMLAAASGLLTPTVVLGAYPAAAFTTDKLNDALTTVLGGSELIDSSDIRIQIPPISGDAGMVPVQIRSELKKIESISVIVEKNPAPFAAYFRLYESQKFISTRIRLAASSDVLVVVKAEGKLYASKRPVRISAGSCL